ncbi:uncharacterized protein LOC126695864 [Quercus robur]|uniref:uncharacterized protein LOC126695864 n=1 Tax=Quercus robur TaxID=38942 RepID=UPI0021632B06|nr:uncharacterized protein LOC126695864 [Quercus robur]
MNETFITLIPKVQGAHKFGHFRPISLCNFCYKVISRILVARLRPLLDKLIDPAQTAFVPNRNIAENVLLAQEVVHSFSTTKKKKGFVGLKLDFQKAYDRVEWPFLIQVLKNFGFHQKFIHLIYQCISIVSFTLLLNGGKGPRIMPSRGLRQRDPLSPYLFIIGSEVLARMINRCSAQRLINGIRIAPSIAGISKLFYADDVLLVCKAKHSEINEIMNILGKYCDWSGQQINFEKSGVFASKGVHSQFLNQLKNQRGLKKLSQGTKYLGVPLFLSSSKKKDFTYLKESLESKWSPSKNSNRYFTPLAWDNLCQPKCLGGLGFRHFSDTNLALLSKVAWWILIQSNKPCVQALIAKYRVRRNWLDADPSKKASWTWKSVESARHILMAGACKQVINWESILTWEDPWVPDLPNYKPVPLSPDKLSSCLVVSQILSPDKSRWDESKLYELFTVESAMTIMRIPVKVSHRVDKWVWVKSHNGKLSMKSAYKELLDHSEPNESDQIFFQPRKNWQDSFLAMDPKCPLCDASPESSLHLFVYCHAARFLWAGNEWGCRPDALQFDCPGQFVKFLLSPQVSSHGTFDKEGFLLFGALVLENLWPEQGAVKINCDAAVGLDHSFIAIVARDWRGDLIFSMSKRVKTNIPIQAEAEAINLATCVTVNRGFEFVVVESDAKACIDALKVPFDEVPWRISSITADTLLLAFHGKKFVFRWSPRDSNKAAHVLASWCLGKNLSGCFGQGYAPSPFLDVINSDLLAAVAAG